MKNFLDFLSKSKFGLLLLINFMFILGLIAGTAEISATGFFAGLFWFVMNGLFMWYDVEK